MLKLINSGCNGYMGRVVTTIAAADPDVEIVAGFDVNAQNTGNYPVYADPADFTDDADVVLDFSNPSADSLLTYGLSKNIPLILCTTGYSPEQIAAVEKTSEQIPVFRSSNMSLGINLLLDLIKRACTVLGDDFDVEIVERHHRRKVDAPSGTALMLASAAAEVLPYKAENVFDRSGKHKQRCANEIGISAVRGGTIIGVHDVIFAGLDEVIEFRHTAASRDVFAAGAIKAAKYMAGIGKPGLYDMGDILSNL
jgi:4-hydroxy-tetrahydrodipicolinate reductase